MLLEKNNYFEKNCQNGKLSTKSEFYLQLILYYKSYTL